MAERRVGSMQNDLSAYGKPPKPAVIALPFSPQSESLLRKVIFCATRSRQITAGGMAR
jgi:hypothetical protein